MLNVFVADPVIGSDHSKQFAGRPACADLAHLSLGQGRGPVQFSARAMFPEDTESVPGVFARGCPLQIPNAVIGGDAVLMVYLVRWSRRRPEKGKSHEPVDKKIPGNSARANPRLGIPAAVRA